MTMITEFADQLFRFMGMKYGILPVTHMPIEDLNWSASDEFTVEIGHAVLMLSYSYRQAFKKQFNELATALSTSERNARYYPVVFAKCTYRAHSPLKVLVICALISEMYLFLLYKSESVSAVKDYVKPSIECFNLVYTSVLSKVDDPILKWKDVKYAASLMAAGYGVFEPIMATEHPAEDVDFFESVRLIAQAKEAQAKEAQAKPEETPAEVLREAQELYVQSRASKDVPKEKLAEVNAKLYQTLKNQSRSLLPKAAKTGGIKASKKATLGASSSDVSLIPDNKGAKKTKAAETGGIKASKKATFGASGRDVSLIPDNKGAKKTKASETGGIKASKKSTLGASSSDVSLIPDNKGAKKILKTPPKAGLSASENALKTKETPSSDVQTASNVPEPDGKGAVPSKKSKKSKKKNRGKAKQAVIKSTVPIEEESKAGTSLQEEPENLKFENLKLLPSETDNKEDVPKESGEEFLI